MPPAPQNMSLVQARTLFLHAQRLLEPTDRPADPDSTLNEIELLGFVQLDSINIVERAHHHILWTRLLAYRPAVLDTLQRRGHAFEHWTHDASIIPTRWFPHWRHRFARIPWNAWLRRRIGPRPRRTLDAVLDRIRAEGPLQARDFEHTGPADGAGWWNWKPAKAALEYWWRRGELAIPHRIRFEKVYDLTERVLPHVHPLPAPPRPEHIDWACRSAIDRLGAATPRQLADFWALIDAKDAAAWCARAVRRGEIVPIDIDGLTNGKPASRAFAPADWQSRLASAPPPPAAARILSPFDPIIRDRARCLRLFGFDYRFEAFTPEPKRRYGYYVLPIFQGDRFIGRLDPTLDRDARILNIRRTWWEHDFKPTPRTRDELDAALQRYAEFVGASRVRYARGAFGRSGARPV